MLIAANLSNNLQLEAVYIAIYLLKQLLSYTRNYKVSKIVLKEQLIEKEKSNQPKDTKMQLDQSRMYAYSYRVYPLKQDY